MYFQDSQKRLVFAELDSFRGGDKFVSPVGEANGWWLAAKGERLGGAGRPLL
jgi:hypothetical protein